MRYVEFYKLNEDGTQSVIVVCGLTGQGALCEGDLNFIENLNREGMTDYSSTERVKLFPKDGLKFLEQARYNFKSGYLNASEVKGFL